MSNEFHRLVQERVGPKIQKMIEQTINESGHLELNPNTKRYASGRHSAIVEIMNIYQAEMGVSMLGPRSVGDEARNMNMNEKMSGETAFEGHHFQAEPLTLETIQKTVADLGIVSISDAELEGLMGRAQDLLEQYAKLGTPEELAECRQFYIDNKKFKDM